MGIPPSPLLSSPPFFPLHHIYTTLHLLTTTTGTPVHFFSHGSTMMLGEDSSSADYWKKCGDEALARNIQGVIIMVLSPPLPHHQR